MRAVRVADLKARLSEHLRAVRSGISLTVLDRNTPIARVVPMPGPRDTAVVHPAVSDWSALALPDPLPESDIVALLREERGDR